MTSVIPKASTATPDPRDQRADQLRAGTYNNTAVCVYDGTRAATVRIGKTGNRYGLCADCTPNPVTEQAITELESFRSKMREVGQASPAVEKFVDDMVLLVSVSRDPQVALDTVFRVLADRPAGAPA